MLNPDTNLLEIETTQNKQKYYSCDVCIYNTINKFSYNIHLKTKKHISLSQSQSQFQLKQEETEYKYKCQYCFKQYKTNLGCKNHINTCHIAFSSTTINLIKEIKKRLDSTKPTLLLERTRLLNERSKEIFNNLYNISRECRESTEGEMSGLLH